MNRPHNFRTWQHWRWSSAGKDKQTPAEKAIKEVHTETKDK